MIDLVWKLSILCSLLYYCIVGIATRMYTMMRATERIVRTLCLSLNLDFPSYEFHRLWNCCFIMCFIYHQSKWDIDWYIKIIASMEKKNKTPHDEINVTEYEIIILDLLFLANCVDLLFIHIHNILSPIGNN